MERTPLPAPIPTPIPVPITVTELADRLFARHRLDPASAKRLPARVSTLVRRTVRALPRHVASSIIEAAPPPRSGDASRYAEALLGLFDAYGTLVPGSVLSSVGRLAAALERLVAAANDRVEGSVPGEAFHAVISDAYEWQAARLTGELIDVRHELLEGYLALVGEGFVFPGRWAALAASELAIASRDADRPVAAAWYAERSLAWAPGAPDLRTTDALVTSIETLVSVGHHLSAIEHSPRFVALLDWRRGMSAPSAVTLRCALARAHSDLGEHTLAIEHAGDALARARRAWGGRARSTQVCDALFDECFQRAIANR
ncbi:MAG: hypothetical protein MUP97_00925 [Acidimicrobiia bacterium]|jgi:hypothetical protein|nr:hypothetical protein [Acidimicrobiia bacterium]